MRPCGAHWLGIVWAALSVAAFGAVAWRVDGLAGRQRYPAPLAARERDEVEAALEAYLDIYQDLFASGGTPDLLNDFPATAPVKHEIFREIGFLRDAGLVQVHDLASATLLEATATAPDVVTAVVQEDWNTETQRAADRSPILGARGSSQAFRYVFARIRGAWVVGAWDLAEEPAKGAGGGEAP